jgi:penicillin amidase
VALNWTAQHARRPICAGSISNAASVDEALALPHARRPVQNFVVGDERGTLAGRCSDACRAAVPVTTPVVPRTGHCPTAANGWLDAAAYPRHVDPAEGPALVGDNRVVGGAELALIGNGGADRGARAQQIRDDLRTLVRAHDGHARGPARRSRSTSTRAQRLVAC